MQSGKNCATNSTIQGTHLTWKQKILLVLTKPYCLLANHNPKFLCIICTGITLFALCYTWTALPTHNQNQFFMYIISLINNYLYTK